MYLKEQSKIIKDGKVLVEETPVYVIIRDFIEQMENRGYYMFVYAVKDINGDEPELQGDDVYQMYGYIDYTVGFTEDDMISAIEGFLINYPPNERVNFAIRMMNTILSDAAVPDYKEEDDDL